jgi:hypothetical protein
MGELEVEHAIDERIWPCHPPIAVAVRELVLCDLARAPKQVGRSDYQQSRNDRFWLILVAKVLVVGGGS